MPLVVESDAEKILTDYLAALLPTLTETDGWSIGTVVKPGVTPVNAVRVRLIGGVSQGRTHARPRLDVRVWGDGTTKGESVAKRVARTLHGYILRDLRATTFALPVPLPDPVDAARVTVLFTVELLTKGSQS